VPTWIFQELDTVVAKRHVRNKYDPLVDEVELVQVKGALNPNFLNLTTNREKTLL